MVERTSGVTELTLECPKNKSFLVRDIRYFPNAEAAEDIKVRIDQRTICQFKAPVAWNLLSEVPLSQTDSLAKLFRQVDLFPTFPVAPGQTFSVTGGAATSFMEVVYDEYDAQDQKASDFNGSECPNYRTFQVISNSGVLATAGVLELNQSDLDSMFPAFPGGEDVPSGFEMRLRALFGAPVTKGTGAANGEYTTYLRLLLDREDITDRDLTGITFIGSSAHTAATTMYRSGKSRLAIPQQYFGGSLIVPPEPLIFKAGQELKTYVTIARTGAGADFVAAELKLGLVLDVYRVG
jgi:hypothetical protein